MDKQKIISTSLEDQDILGYCRGEKQIIFQILVVRNGKMVGEKIYKIKNLIDADDNEILSAFLKQHYLDQILLPKEILLPHSIDDLPLILDWLSKKKQRPCLYRDSIKRKKERSCAYGRGKC